MAPPDRFRLEDLLERSDWIRALAASLARDPERAEDLAQSTIAVALEKRPASGVPPRRWLAAIMRNLLRQDLRATRRRATREEDAARPESVPPESTLVERLEIHRKLVDAVRALDEPYRSAILLRYFEALQPAEIAERTNAPVRTVHSHLNRGLHLLRQRLDAELGDRETWLGLLLPMASGKAGTLGATGGILVSTKAAIAVGTMCAVLVAAWFWSGRGVRTSQPLADSAKDSETPAVVEKPPVIGSTAAGTREVIGTPPAEPRSKVAEETWRVRGRVLDVRGNPVANVHVGVREQDHARTTSDPFGKFELEVRPGSLRLVAVDDAWITLRYGQLYPEIRDREHVIVVARFVALAGTVVDASEHPLEGAAVDVDVPLSSFAAFPLPLDTTGLEAPTARTKADGTFRIARAPVVAGASLVSRFESLRPDARPIPDHSIEDFRIQLRESSPIENVLEGTVEHEDETPAAGARIHLGGAADVRADEEGKFRLPLQKVYEHTPLVATLAGSQPAVVPDYDLVLESTDLHPPPVRLVLGPPPLAIAGRVIAKNGSPLAAWTVGLFDPLVLTPNRSPSLTAEKLTANAEPKCVTREDGRFRIEGLRNVAYRLQAWNRDGAVIYSDPIQAGAQDVVLELPDDAFVDRVTGRVVARDGTAIANAFVQVVVTIDRTGHASAVQTFQTTKAKSDGTFELVHVPRRCAGLNVSGEALESKELDLGSIDLARPVEIVVVRMCALRFEDDGGKDPALEYTVLDGEGKDLHLVLYEAGRMSGMAGAQVVQGRSHVVWVREDAARIVLRGESGIVGNQPLSLVPGEVNVVRRER